ncbi:MAG: bifunctional phosphopantothenoylcysteine decarboxylase/phosphopantothenate--cysteine ligase CoaBC, partial [Pseudomonadota bacterium]
LKEESEMGHIRLSREADLVVVAPASADILAKMAAGMANDLATTALLATDKPVLVAPAMNVMMWQHPATQANMETLRQRGISVIGPAAGDLACGEVGSGRMSEPLEIVAAVRAHFDAHTRAKPLAGLRAVVTSGPTREPIDPVRYISNHSSGKQGHAIAGALAGLGADTVLVSGPVTIPTPSRVALNPVETAEQMLSATQAALPADIVVCAAAVADWKVLGESTRKLKKEGAEPPRLEFAENPDILATISQLKRGRPRLIIGFAAETNDLIEQAQAKRKRKGCDWILANDVSLGTDTFGGEDNQVHLIAETGIEPWPRSSKVQVAEQLAERIIQFFQRSEDRIKPEAAE